MPGQRSKPFRIRVRTLDGRPRDTKALNKLKSNELGMPHLDIMRTEQSTEFILCAPAARHIEEVRAKLSGVGLEEVPGGATEITGREGGKQDRGRHRAGPQQHRQAREAKPEGTEPESLPKKPYGFVALPERMTTDVPVWHDGTGSKGRLSGEIRFELETLTPLLVGCERGVVGEDSGEPWPFPEEFKKKHQLVNDQSVLCPLRAPWGERPVILPGDSLKGLLRHELGALLGAPMERVAERSYSYRPNLKFPSKGEGRFLEPRLARVRSQQTVELDKKLWPVPKELDVYSMATREEQTYYPSRESDRPSAHVKPYRGGLGGGQPLPSAIQSEDAHKKIIHTHLDVGSLAIEHKAVPLSKEAIYQYRATLAHLMDTDAGHFSARHPQVGADQEKQKLGRETIEKAAASVFQPGDLIWVEWDTEKKHIVSFGWHYYYRWAYADTVRRTSGDKRPGLFPLLEEQQLDPDGAPAALSPVRRLFGYTGDNEGSAGIGKDDYAQLMGRLSVNAALEVVQGGERDRFCGPIFLKELGMPRPSAVEFYLKQPDYPTPKGRPDKAKLLTYRDAAGYDTPGELAGRKFYLDRQDAYIGKPWKHSEQNLPKARSTLALEASKPGRRFRFTARFRDLDPAEVAAVLVAFCPHQFRELLGGTHPDGYCSKLGYARPLGWGSVRIEAKALLLLDPFAQKLEPHQVDDLTEWVKGKYQPTATQTEWLAAHRCKHPDAGDYPRENDGEIYKFHSSLRAEHARLRRYRRKENQ